jgi:hypothetical protein
MWRKINGDNNGEIHKGENKFSALGQKEKGKEFNKIYIELMKDKKNT